MHFFPMAMFTHKLVPPPDNVSSSLGETRSGINLIEHWLIILIAYSLIAKRGPVGIAFLDETDGLGGLKDKEFTRDVQEKVELMYKKLIEKA
jgi:hypothetical protein